MRYRLLGAAAGMVLAGTATAEAQSGQQPLQFVDIFSLEMAANPQISPDGDRVVYQRRSNDIMTDQTASALWIVDYDGSNHLPLVTGPGNYSGAVWAPDSERLAFVASEDEKTQRRVVWPGQGVTATLATLPSGASNISWSPDGEWLAYLSYEERVAGANVLATALPTAQPPPGQTPVAAVTVDEAELWIVSADAELKYQLTNFPTGSVTQPRWSPDSELISFVWSPQNSSDMLWMIANQPAAIPTQLSYEWSMVLESAWLPDATGVIGAMREFRETIPNILWQVPLVNTDDSLAVHYLETLNITHADFPRFSPDGQWLAVRSNYEMLLIDMTENTSRLLDRSVIGNTAGVWSPEGFSGEASCN